LDRIKKKMCDCGWERKPGSSKLVWPLLSIREAFEYVSDKQNPAKATITWPEGESPQFLINELVKSSLHLFSNSVLMLPSCKSSDILLSENCILKLNFPLLNFIFCLM
jgi:hypothetical protein